VSRKSAEAFRCKIKEQSEKMLKPWEDTAGYLINVFKHHIKRCALAEAPIFSEEYLSTASKVAGLDEPAKVYLAYLIDWSKSE